VREAHWQGEAARQAGVRRAAAAAPVATQEARVAEAGRAAE